MKIAAVVVTYNRLNLLKECINEIREQSKKVDEIIVVNNGSTDGTFEWLESQKDLTVIHQENLGGAGGFYTGIKFAYEKGYDWIWCMDDDGKPQRDTLEKLTIHSFNVNAILHPVVLSEDYECLSFGCIIFPKTANQILVKSIKEIKTMSNFKNNLLPSYGSPFNGTLIPKEIIKQIGFPKAKYFIWGDEVEYILRAVNAGFESFLVLDSFFFHPHNPKIYSLLSFEYKDWWKLYYFFRNKREQYYFDNNKLIGTLKYLKSNITFIFNVIFNQDIKRFSKAKIILLATYHSIINKFGKYDLNLN